jgi:gliding motility-associated-like protein
VTPLFTDDINCDGISQTFTITVNPSAQVDEPNDQVLCNGDSILVEFTTQNTIGNTTFSWTSDIDFGNGLAGSGNIDFNVVNNGTFPSVATVTVIPIIENLGVSCFGPSQLFNVTVNGNIDPKPTISDYNGYQISCFEANDGFINLSPEGGTPNDSEPFYSYQWIGPNNFSSNDQNIENLEPGTYNLTISDSLNCSFEFEYEINEPDPLEIIVDEQSDVQCNGIFDGIISISPQGGAAPYTYEWTKDGVFFSDQQNINNLEPGIYVLFLNDANECGPISQIFEIVQPDPIEISLENSVDILCFGENTGSIDINVIGGTPEQMSTGVSIYNYAWTGPNGYTSNDSDIFNLFAGIYSLTVTDSLGCQESFEVELVEPEDLIINFETTDNTCYESNDGTITLDIQGGVEPYQIFWSNFGNGPTQTNLSAGIYEVTVIDAHDCEEITNIEIIEAPIFDTDPVSTDISCFGANDGSINLNIIGGIEPVFVTWDDDTTAGEERNNLLPGTYNVIIEDSSGNNCFITHEFIIIEPQELSLSSIIENAIDCENVNSGSIDLQVTGGTAPYTFQWNSGQITEDLENIAPGNYSVVVIDSKGCEVTDSFSIYRQEDFETSLDISFEADCENDIPYQITTINIEGGVAPYEIIWSSGDVSGDNNETMTSSQNGTVIVDVTDSIGCQTQVIFDIDLFTLGSPGFEYSSPGLTECEALGVGDLIQFTNTSTGDFISVDWNFGDNGLTVINEENPTHVYSQSGTYVVTQTVYYEYGCVDVFEEILYVTEGYALVLPNAFTPNGDGINDTIRPWFKCMTNVEISIYDTFGSLLYVESGDDIYGWNGLINGQMAENGNYIVVVKATTLFGEIINLNGPITLIR